MSSHPPEPTVSGQHVASQRASGKVFWGSLLLSAALLIWFYGFETRYDLGAGQSAFRWIYSAWNGETDYEHGKLFPFVIAGLIFYRLKDLKAVANEGSYWGLISVFIGVAFYIISFRTLQPRIAMGGLPFILWGGAWYLWGWQVAKILTFPLFFSWLAIPLPGFQQATTHLQLLATSLAHHGSALCGVQTYVEGTKVLPMRGNWQPLDIAAGCSGIRSLMALLMISAIWAYIAKIALWKKVVLFLSAFPLAIIGNALRVTSIFVIAEYGNAEWARGTWHDWSGLLLFYPFSLLILLIINSILEGGLPWKKRQPREVRRVVVSQQTQPEPSLPDR
jgi:exosortase